MDFPEQLWLPLDPWKCPRPGWMELGAAWDHGKCLCPWQGWDGMSFEVPPNPTRLFPVQLNRNQYPNFRSWNCWVEPGEREGLWESGMRGPLKAGKYPEVAKGAQGVTRSVNPGDKSIPRVVFLPLPQCGIWMVLSLEALTGTTLRAGKGFGNTSKGTDGSC